jgi:hypothetical protein
MKAALWCPATDCLLWLFRLGLNPDTVRVKYGPGLVTPSMMPDPYTNLDDLPNGVEAAAAYVRPIFDTVKLYLLASKGVASAWGGFGTTPTLPARGF